MKNLDMEYIETPISPLKTSDPLRLNGTTERLLSDKLDTFLRTRRTQPFTKLLKHLME